MILNRQNEPRQVHLNPLGARWTVQVPYCQIGTTCFNPFRIGVQIMISFRWRIKNPITYFSVMSVRPLPPHKKGFGESQCHPVGVSREEVLSQPGHVGWHPQILQTEYCFDIIHVGLVYRDEWIHSQPRPAFCPLRISQPNRHRSSFI